MSNTILLEKISTYVADLFESHADNKLVYHNATHTKKVVTNVAEIIKHDAVTAEEEFILLAAAWLHDTGHLFGSFEDHEKESVRVSNTFLATLNVAPNTIESIASCIMATKMPSNPQNNLEQIICDADTFNLGTDDFKITDELVRQELELRTGKCFSNWHSCSIQFLTQHQYFTSYCRSILNAGKELNISYLQSLIKQRA